MHNLESLHEINDILFFHFFSLLHEINIIMGYSFLINLNNKQQNLITGFWNFRVIVFRNKVVP